jgi:hypothetical protein
MDEAPVKSLREWERRLKANLRERGCPEEDVDRRADEMMRRVFESEWMEALRSYQCGQEGTF